MKKLLLIPVFFIATIFCAISQPGNLLARKNEKGLYLDHKVVAKEGLFSIGRLYNVHPKSIAAFNNMDMNKGLAIGQVIHIPLTDTNFIQKGNKGIAVYYVVGSNDGLQKVSNQYNKVSLQNLRNWNNLKGDNINSGSKLIVGFLLSKEMPAVAASKPVEKEPVKKQLEEKKPLSNSAEKAIVKDQPLKEDVLVQKEVKLTEIEVETDAAEQEKMPVAANSEQAGTTFAKEINTEGQGYFRPYFDQQVRTTPASKKETVTAGIFKTKSGWQDSKYYLLIDGAPTGSIVKLVNPDNNKAVYAKVLGQMNGIRQNQGLGVRISNAAAAALGVTDTEKFIVNLNY